MKIEELEVYIDPEGRVSITVRGIKGKGCMELTKPLEDALGSDVDRRIYTSEYYEREDAIQRQQTR